MKLKKKINATKRPERDEEDESPKASSKKQPKMGDASWMITGLDDLKKAQKRQEMQARRSRRAPEIYMKDGESKTIHIASDAPIGMWRYSVRVNGKFRKFTKPDVGEKDLFEKSGLTPALAFLYPAIDRTGYVDRQTNKKHKNLPRFFTASGRVEKQLDKIREKKGSLTRWDIEVSRSGSTTDTTYTFFLDDEPSKLTDEEKIAVKRELLDKIHEFYAPPSLEEQKAILAGVHDDDEDEDDSSGKSRKPF